MLLYGLCCGLLGSALMFALDFSLGLLPRSFSVFVAYFAVRLALENGKVVNVFNGHLPGTFFQHRLDEGAIESVGPHAPYMRVGRRGSPAQATDGGRGSFSECVCKPRVGWRWALTRPP